MGVTVFVGGRVVDGCRALVCVGFGEVLTTVGSTGAGAAAGLRGGACGTGIWCASGRRGRRGDGDRAVGTTAAVESTGPRATTATADTAMATANTARLDSAATFAARLYK